MCDVRHMKTIVSYGGGTNSCAVLIGLRDRGILPDAILFADTGGELPETYAHIEYMRGWFAANGFPDITVVKSHQPSKHGSLEAMCLANKILPAIAYGFKACSVQYKIEPIDKWLRDNGLADAIRFIGIDAGEAHRAKDLPQNRYPLIEWDWDRDDCIAAIDKERIPRPGKSSCFFCPNSKVSEIKRLAKRHPDLYARAIAMEDNANLTTIKGLGRSFSWRDVTSTGDMFPEGYAPEMPCGCYDG